MPHVAAVGHPHHPHDPYYHRHPARPPQGHWHWQRDGWQWHNRPHPVPARPPVVLYPAPPAYYYPAPPGYYYQTYSYQGQAQPGAGAVGGAIAGAGIGYLAGGTAASTVVGGLAGLLLGSTLDR